MKFYVIEVPVLSCYLRKVFKDHICKDISVGMANYHDLGQGRNHNLTIKQGPNWKMMIEEFILQGTSPCNQEPNKTLYCILIW